MKKRNAKHNDRVMAVYQSAYNSIPASVRYGALTIGNFDGVHRGHQALIAEVRRQADLVDGPAVAMTFDPPPSRLLRANSNRPPLTTLDQRAELMQQFGIDHIVILQTTLELLRLDAKEFFDQILVDQFAALAIIEGSNFHFGRDRSGSIAVLEQFCQPRNITLQVVADQQFDDTPVSSSRVRTAILAGEIAIANQMLGRKYTISGRVEHGLARGRTIGFPTANLGDCAVLLPGHGVYAGQVEIERQVYAAAIHIGPNITFDESEAKVECHLIDFSGDLYGQVLVVELAEKIRGVIKFDSVEALVAQMKRDVQQCGHLLSNIPMR